MITVRGMVVGETSRTSYHYEMRHLGLWRGPGHDVHFCTSLSIVAVKLFQTSLRLPTVVTYIKTVTAEGNVSAFTARIQSRTQDHQQVWTCFWVLVAVIKMSRWGKKKKNQATSGSQTVVETWPLCITKRPKALREKLNFILNFRASLFLKHVMSWCSQSDDECLSGVLHL